MSRSGYSEDCDGWELIRWRGAVESAIRGKRGQAMLADLVAALDALPDKSLASESLVNTDGEYCALGALGRARGMDMAPIDPEDRQAVARAFGVAETLAAEVMFLNDEDSSCDWLYIDVEICGPMRGWQTHKQNVRVPNPRAGEVRWRNMRAWAAANVKTPPEGGAS